MSFFLSKFLPLFIYPLGIVITLLVVALVCLIRLKRRPAIAAISAALVILYMSSMPFLSDLLVRSLEYQNLPPQEIPVADAIVVLGGGTKAQIPPRPWIEVSEAGDRILYGSRLWLQKKAPLLILSGGRTSLFGGGGRAESEDMAKIAIALGVNKSSILQDPDSLNTYENALNVQKLLQKSDLHKIILVTSAMHTPRSLAIFQKLGIEAIAAPTDFNVVENPQPPNIFAILPDVDALKNTTNALKEYIGLIIYKLYGWL
jgi:uncharacterized SAM-binding protein YcdF (DUF218 family)